MLTLAQVAIILVAHGIYTTDSDLAAFVAESCSPTGCSKRALRDFLGY